MMIDEVATYGVPLDIKAPQSQSEGNLRAQRDRQEEQVMQSEVRQYGAVLSYGSPGESLSLKPAALNLSPDFFDPHDPNRRPAEWRGLLQKRVEVKKQALYSVGVSPSTNLTALDKLVCFVRSSTGWSDRL